MVQAALDRADPDALLARVTRDEREATRGAFRIYFGASAGVGKTYAMLLAARNLKAEGCDVVTGIVETHGRGETAALLNGALHGGAIETIPMAPIAHEGRTLAEFDLDAALARKPELMLVDELAHSNAPGSRHAKRWQDVDELLAAGIDVFTTLNVQHLESRRFVRAALESEGWQVFEAATMERGRLLATLVAHAGKVLTHRLLLREVWGPNHVESSHYLRVYMSHLRSKLEDDAAQPRYLLTETAVGYRLVN